MADPRNPLLAEAVNNRLALQRRMEMEGQAAPIIPDQPLQPAQRFGMAFTPQDKAMQQAALIQILRQRMTQMPQQPVPAQN